MIDLTKVFASTALLLAVSACTNYYEIGIETPLQPKLDVSQFQRVLIAGFVAGGTEDIDGNLETARLLRSQLRSESRLQVIDTDVLDLLEIARNESISENQEVENGNGNSSEAIENEDGKNELSEEYLRTVERNYAMFLINFMFVFSFFIRAQ